MSKFITLLFICLGIIHFSWAQKNTTLFLEIKDHSDSIQKTTTYNSFEKATRQLDFKIDSLKKTGYPFLEESRLINDSKIHSSILLNNKIDSIRLNIETEYLKLLPKSFKVTNNYIEVPYSKIDLILAHILNELKAEGSAFGKASLADIKIIDNIIEANLAVKKGNKRTIDKINIKGYDQLSKNYISRYSGLKVGRAFMESSIQDKAERLNNIAFVNVTKPIEVLFKKDSTELFLYLEKLNSNNFDGFLGFGNSDNNNFQLNGYVNITLLNNLDNGERLDITYKNNGDGIQNFETEISLPFILNSPISFDAGLKILRRDSLFSNNYQKLNLNYQLNDRYSIGSGIEFINSTNIAPENLTPNDNVFDYKSSFYGINLEYLNPTKRLGFSESSFLNITGTIGKRNAQINSDQYQLRIEGQYELSLGYRNKILLNVNSQFLISDQYLNNELYRFGGINSIRGFSENALIANQFTILRTEYRYILDSNLLAKAVLDIGTYKNKLNNTDDNILGYGLGLSLKSGAGVFTLIAANSISSNNNTNLSNTKIHIGFVSYF